MVFPLDWGDWWYSITNVRNALWGLQERSSSLLSSTSGYEGYSKPATGAMGDRMSAMKQAFQVELLLFIFCGYWLIVSFFE